jgi:hypothetical protein
MTPDILFALSALAFLFFCARVEWVAARRNREYKAWIACNMAAVDILWQHYQRTVPTEERWTDTMEAKGIPTEPSK